MIKSFKSEETLRVYMGETARRLPPEIQTRARAKLRQLEAATQLEALRTPPKNHLEPLLGDRAGQWSIRINRQWRLCFKWEGQDASDVEIIDYHH